jgi:type II secretory pathway component PulC
MLVFAGCAAPRPTPAPTPTPTATHQPEPAAIAPAASREPSPSPGDSGRLSPAPARPIIRRAELLRVLDQSPGLFLQHVDSEPQFQRGRFYGWRLRAFFPGDGRFASVNLRPGDIVLHVNGSTLERPEQLMETWDALRTAGELVVDFDRAGRAHQLVWQIVD